MADEGAFGVDGEDMLIEDAPGSSKDIYMDEEG